MLKYMLDTNIVIYTIKNKPLDVKKAFETNHGQMCISTVVLMELIYGAEKSLNVKGNIEIIEGLTARMDVLPYEDKAAYHSGQIRAELARAGTPIGPYDQMIAGHARSKGLVLVTNNIKEFERVPGLMLENWTN